MTCHKRGQTSPRRESCLATKQKQASEKELSALLLGGTIKLLIEMIIDDRQPDEAQVALRWSARSVGAVGVTAAGALWALKEQQPGDVPQTWADVSHANRLFGYQPTTSFADGMAAFYEWWKQRS